MGTTIIIIQLYTVWASNKCQFIEISRLCVTEQTIAPTTHPKSTSPVILFYTIYCLLPQPQPQSSSMAYAPLPAQ